MSYAGQNAAKRGARACFWVKINEMRDLKSDRVLVLCGPNAGDVSCLLTLGVQREQITAVDLDPRCCETTLARFPGVDVRLGSVTAVLRRDERFGVAFLDYCTHISTAMVKTTWRVADRHVLGCGGVLGVGYMRGREKQNFQDLRGRLFSSLIYEEGEGDYRAMMLQRGMWEHCEAHKRYWTTRLHLVVRYQGNRVPMEYDLLTKHDGWSSAADGYLPFGGGERLQVSSKYPLRESVVWCAKKQGSRFAAGMFDLDEGRVRAWLAVANRKAAA